MNHLLRSYAPISDEGWSQLDQEVQQRLAARVSPRAASSTSPGRTAGSTRPSTSVGSPPIDAPVAGSAGRAAPRAPLAELRADRSRSRVPSCATSTAARSISTSRPSTTRRERMAEAENVAVFHGWKAAGIVGITDAGEQPPIAAGKKFARLPEARRQGGRDVALGRRQWSVRTRARARQLHRCRRATEHGGLTVFDHLREILGGPIVWAPGVVGAVVVSLRGGDFLFESGEDLSVGYDHHDADNVYLYIEESFTFRVATPEAAVVLKP